MSWKARRYQRHLNRNRHHLVPRSRGGYDDLANLLLIDIECHQYWHKVFGNRTLEEVIELLLRVHRAKQAQKRAA